MKKGSRFFCLFLLLSVSGITISAADTEAEKVLAQAHLFGDSPYLKMEVEMRMVNPSGEKSRIVDISMSNSDDEKRVFMQITSPSFLRKMKFLQYNPENGDTLQWIATSRGARKITSSGEDERVFDSDFTAADFSSLKTEDYRIESFSEEPNREVLCYRFELIPRDREGEVTKKILFLDRRSLLIREVGYYQGRDLVRRYRLLSTMSIEGSLFPEEGLMENLRESSSTRLIFHKIEMPASIPDRVFHYRNL